MIILIILMIMMVVDMISLVDLTNNYFDLDPDKPHPTTDDPPFLNIVYN